MAVTRLWSVNTHLKVALDYVANPEKTLKANSKYSDPEYYASLQNVLDYISDEDKTERMLFCDGINCNPETAYDDFVKVKKRFGKSGGIQAYHGYMSFKEDNIAPELAQKVGMEFAERMWGDRFQVVVSTHLNTTHLHCHFAVNSVSFIDGKKLHGAQKVWFRFYKVADEVCRKYGLHILEEPDRRSRVDYAEFSDNKNPANPNSKYALAREALDKAIKASTNPIRLEKELRKLGYFVDFNPNHKYWTMVLKGNKRPTRLHRLGSEYTKDRILERLKENRGKSMENDAEANTQTRHAYYVRRYKIRTCGDQINVLYSGLCRLYLYYCYQIGALPKYKVRQNGQRANRKLHYLLRDELGKLDELTAQTNLLVTHKIETTEQLGKYKKAICEEIELSAADRCLLRGRLRRTGTPDSEKSKIQEEITVISKRLKKLRKELKLCNGIEARSHIVRERSDTVLKDEIKYNKEDLNNEHKR